MVASFAAEDTFKGAITLPGIFVEAAGTRPRHHRKPARINQTEKKKKKRLVVATGGCQILWVEMWQPQEGCVLCMGECVTHVGPATTQPKVQVVKERNNLRTQS